MKQAYENAINYVLKRDAALVYKAGKGIGTHDSLLIQILSQRTKDQIEKIDQHYRLYIENHSHKSLFDFLESECSGDYGTFLKHVAKSRPNFLAKQLSQAMDGIGCNKSLINEIFCLSSTEDLVAMRSLWERSNDKSLADRLRSELSGEHENLIIYLLNNGRGNGPKDVAFSTKKAEELHNVIKNGKTMMGGLSSKAERNVGEILCQISIAQIEDLKIAWDQKWAKDGSLQAVLKSKLSGDFEDAVLTLCTTPLDACCANLKKAMDGIGTDENALSFTLGGVTKAKAMEISARYFQKYDNVLVARLQSEVSGNYLNALVSYLTIPDPTNGLEDEIAKGGATEALYAQAYNNVKQSIANLDAFLLNFAGKGIGSDEDLIIEILCTKNKQELDAVDLAYRRLYNNRTLKDFIHSELSGDLAEFLAYMQMNENEFDAYILHKAFEGLGCDKELVLEIFCTRSFARLQASRQYYEQRKDGNLIDRVKKELSGNLEKLCLKLLTVERNNSNFNAEQIADQLYAFGEGKFGTNESGFIDIFTSNSQQQLQAVAVAYENKYHNSLMAAIKSEFSGPMKTALTYLFLDSIEVTCKLLKKATIDKVGTNEGLVNRCIGGYDKLGIQEIAARFFSKYDRSLVAVLQSELSGDFKKAVITYVSSSGVTDVAPQKQQSATSVTPQQHVPQVVSYVQPPQPPTQQQQQQHIYQQAPVQQHVFQQVPPQQVYQQQGFPSQQPIQMGYVQPQSIGGFSQPVQQGYVVQQGFVQQHAPQQQVFQQHVPPQQTQLPPGWDLKYAPDGRAYYVNHNTHTTQWNRPT